MTLWRKSSRSASSANCVEVAYDGDRVHTRDSKHPGPTLNLPTTAWGRFVRRVQG
ncbi:DUF397 domain-containing protein [Saccharothrix obliqua]|uniref:DUF397 domain-containing protein n=1 Tax=Saccharothrix obliqua TaxID=2861747 RepID=UPI001C605D18|nr:DUF397 domain-containing protein [Saccharothrix obliqua]MBW4719010.1 DUF397 domain-containing protein [Saccharothrix obliqua]